MAENKDTKNWITIAFIAAVIAILMWMAISRQRAQKSVDSWVGQKAADFALPDLQGKIHNLSDYKGKKVMVVFWATWCQPCRLEVPRLIELRNQISQEKLAILAITQESDIGMIKSFVNSQNINYTVLWAGGQDIGEPYNLIDSIPRIYFINTEGVITAIHVGLMEIEEMKAMLQTN